MTVLVHDYLLVNRGAERSFTTLCEMYPGAPIATLLFDPEVFGWLLEKHGVSTSRLQRLGLSQTTFKALLPAFPAAVERLPVGGHDLVISSSSAFAHGVSPDPGATHVCYCYTPFRYAWYETQRATEQVTPAIRPLLKQVLAKFQRWDVAKATRNTHYVAISGISQERIRKYWGRDAPIVYPPVDVGRFATTDPDEFFLFVGEVVRHKQLEVALRAAELAGVPIKIVGGGSDEQRLRDAYESRDGVEFLGRISDGQLDALYPKAKALVMPNIEEFGITAVEAQAAGRPVLAADGGGARETVIEGTTGLFFEQGDVEALAEAMRSPALRYFEPADAISSAMRFSRGAFQEAMQNQIDIARASKSAMVPAGHA